MACHNPAHLMVLTQNMDPFASEAGRTQELTCEPPRARGQEGKPGAAHGHAAHDRHSKD